MKKIPYQSPLSRRQFVGTAALATAAFTIVPRHVLGGPKFVPPSEKVNIAIVGAGGQGRTNARGLFPLADAQIIAVADPCEQFSLEDYYFKGMGGRKPVKAEIEKRYSQTTPNFKVAEYEDFRVMLEKEKSIDAVLCATTDHLHAYVTVLALRAGKHVYCEKPLTHNVWEARLVAKVTKETGLATQMGNQGHSGEGLRQTCEWIAAGAIGTVREVHAWTAASRWNRKYSSGRPAEEAIPAGVNWDLWIGPRQMRPYSSCYHPVSWRDYWEFGTAPIGDFFCHNFDPAFTALNLRDPLSIEAHGVGGVDAEMAPPGGIYTYMFGPRGDRPAVKFVWYDGGLMPARPEGLESDDQLGAGGNGTLFIGDKGMLTCPGWAGEPRLLPGTKHEEYKRPPKTMKRSKGHHRDWIDACKGGDPASANFEYGAGLTEVGLMGLAAMRARTKLYWDAEKQQFTDKNANRFFKGFYRPGWEIPA
jgi:predicted dehydrogenase